MKRKSRTTTRAALATETTRRRPAVRRTLAATCAAVLAATLLAACGSGSSEGGTSGGELKIANLGDVPAYDPVVLGPTGTTQTLSLVYEPLFVLDEQGRLTPGLATEYSFNDKGDQLTLTLREGLTFQDGSPLDAEAVAYHFERGLSQENSALKAAYHEVKSVEVVDATHLRINLTRTDFGFPLILANRSSLIPSKKAAEADPKALNANEPVGAGPFKVVKLVPGAEIVLEKWNGYWDADNIHIDKVKVSLGTDPAMGVASADFINANNAGEKVAVIYNNADAYSTGIYQAFAAKAEEYGLDVVATSTFTDDTTDFSVQLTAAKEAGATIVFIPIYYTPASMILNQASAMEFAPLFIGVDGMDGILNLEGFDTALAEGVIMLTPFSASSVEEPVASFVKNYEAVYGVIPDQFAADGYDAVYALYEACDRNGIDGSTSYEDACETLIAAFADLEVTGVTGTMTWNPDGTVTKVPKAVRIENGAYVGIGE